jgi:hypothetical protein
MSTNQKLRLTQRVADSGYAPRFSRIYLALSFFYISSLVHDRQAAEDNKEEFFGIIRRA